MPPPSNFSFAFAFLGVRGYFLGNSRIPYYVILGLDPRISIEILNLFVMRSPDQVGGMTQGLGILEFHI